MREMLAGEEPELPSLRRSVCVLWGEGVLPGWYQGGCWGSQNGALGPGVWAGPSQWRPLFHQLSWPSALSVAQ